jgi:hypothetical protein
MNNYRGISITALCLALCLTLSGCCIFSPGPGPSPSIVFMSGDIGILKQPRSRMAEVGTHVEFGVIATNLMGTNALSYQWKINGGNIDGATNNAYWIDNVGFTNVATYTVEITAGTNYVTSAPAHLAIYSLFGTNSNGGTMSTPIGWFEGQANTCASGGTFERAFCPTNDTGWPAFFYGKYATNQTGPFQNTVSPKLTIDTFHCDNGTGDTGLMLQRNWTTGSPVMCNDNAGSPPAPGCHPLGAKGGPITLNTGLYARYRLTLMYKLASPPPSGTVAFNWLYHN